MVSISFFIAVLRLLSLHRFPIVERILEFIDDNAVPERDKDHSNSGNYLVGILDIFETHLKSLIIFL